MRRLPVFALVLALVPALVAGAAIAAAQDASPTATPAALPPPLDAWDAAWASGDIEAILTTYTEDVVFEEVPFILVVCGQDELRAHLEALYAAFPDIKFVATGDAFVAGDRAAVEWTATGTSSGQIPGLPPGEGQTAPLPGCQHPRTGRQPGARRARVRRRRLLARTARGAACARHTDAMILMRTNAKESCKRRDAAACCMRATDRSSWFIARNRCL